MAALPFKVKATFDYASPHEDDLSFSNGQIITVTDEEDADWYYGEYAGVDGQKKQGLFPRNFVERYEPTTPPRPSRHPRPKRELEVEHDSTPHTRSEAEEEKEEHPTGDVAAKESMEEPSEASAVALEPVEQTQVGNVSAEAPPSGQVQQRKSLERQIEQDDVKSAPTAPSQAAKSPQPSTTKSPPPSVASKPASSSFRDRIAAFNRSSAQPVQPVKSGQPSSFVKKPYVPPPPSRDAYVRPPPEVPQAKVYKAQEDPNAQGVPAKEDTRTPGVGGGEDQPQPTSLKERIALLQKQQLEQAARHAEAAQKKEKPKKPPKKRSEPATEPAGGEEAPLERAATGAAVPDTESDVSSLPKPTRLRSRSKDGTPTASPMPAPQEFMSDSNDADQSAGGDTEDGEAPTAGRKVHRAPAPVQPPLPPARQPAPVQPESEEDETQESPGEEPQQGPLGAEAEEDEEVEEAEEPEGEEEEDIDPEIKRRMEIRDRMAKMSGGMGMAGMFGMPGGLPPKGTNNSKASGGTSKKQSMESEVAASASPPSQPVPIMALPGMAMPVLGQVRTPEPMDNPMESVETMDPRESESRSESLGKPRVEEKSFRAEPKSKAELRSPPPPPPNESYVPAVPPTPSTIPSTGTSRAPPPPPPSTRPSQPPTVPSRPVDAGFESDDELSGVPQDARVTDTSRGTSSITRRAPPVPPVATTEDRQKASGPQSPESTASPSMPKPPTSPQSPSAAGRRTSRGPPPIPGAAAPAISPPPHSRAPPPPPPPTRESDRPPTPPPPSELPQEESEEVTEYEGDYDTDIAPGATHKDALKADDQDSSADDTLTGDEASYHHSGLPSLGPPTGPPPVPTSSAPRGAPPPPPPGQPPKLSRQSSDAPRAPPPRPSQPPVPSRQSTDIPRAAPPPPPVPAQTRSEQEEDYDPYNYNRPPPNVPPKNAPSRDPLVTPRAERPQNDLYGTSIPGISRTESAEAAHAPQASAGLGVPQSSQPRESLDIPRSSTSRRSVDATRPSTEQGFMATDLDIGRNTQWWVQRNMPPPALQDRPDVTYEIEESGAISQNGEELVMRHVYALYLDYSQTILTARFNPHDPSRAEFNQRHQPPPSTLRQDQLETAHMRFGTKLAEAAKSRENTTVGNGTPFAFVMELFHAIPDALPPIGSRGYGSVIYTNLANASVQQYDEIRKGDILSFRNAKLQGHKGAMKQKYNIDVGKPDHVAVVVDWDGTRKKVRVWEQGRESRKVKEESFKLGDLRSGEVKIWRVVSREWVGWGRKS